MSTKKLIKALGLIIVVALLAAALPLQAKAQSTSEVVYTVCSQGCNYTTIQSAVQAVRELSDPGTPTTYRINVGAGIYDTDSTIDIVQQNNKNIVLNGESKELVTIKDQIRIDGNARHNAAESVTIQDFTFDFSGLSDDIITTAKLVPGKYVYAHNITVKDCDFLGNPTLEKYGSVVAVRATASGGHTNFVLENLTGTHIHSLIQATSVTLPGVTVNHCTVTDSLSGLNLVNSPGFVDYFTYSGLETGIRTNFPLTVTNSSIVSAGSVSNPADPKTAIVTRYTNNKVITITDSLIKNSNEGNYAIANDTSSPVTSVTLVIKNVDTGGGNFDLALVGGLGPVTLISTSGDTAIYKFFTTIQSAIDAASDGDTINVAAGTYNENLVVNKSLNLIGAGDDLVTVNGVAPTTDAGMVNIVASNVTIDGFKFVAEGYKTIRLNAPTTDVTFSNNTVIGAEYTSGGGWILFESNYNNAHSNLTITGNVFENHGGQIGVYLNPQITGLTFTGNTFQGDPTSGPVLGIDGMNGTEVITGNSFAGITSPYALFEGFGDFSIVGIFNANTWPAGYIASGNRVVPASVVYPSTNDINRTNGWAHVDFVSADADAQTMTFNFVQTRNFFSCVEYRTSSETSPYYQEPNYNLEILDGLWRYTCSNTTGQTPITIELGPDDTHVEFRLSFGAEKDERFYWTPFAFVPEAWVDDEFTSETPGWGVDRFAVIQNGINAVATNGIVHVAAGTYDEDLNINKGVTLRAADLIETVVLSDTAGPGVWFPDRYRPAVFEAASWEGRNAIKHGVREEDSAANRPAAYRSDFYNTQGRKYQTSLTGDVQRMSIDLWVDVSWETSQVYAGLWSTGFDATSAISAYPIIAWRSPTGTTPGFYVWDYYDTGSWTLVKAAEAGDYGKWHTLAFELKLGQGFQYYLDGQPVGAFLADTDTASLGNVILNVYNYGADYDVYWDNFSTHGVNIVGQATVNASDVTFDGFNLSNPGANFGMLVNPGFSNVTITGNTFENIGAVDFADNVKGIYLLSGPDSVTIEGNTFRNIHAGAKSVNAVNSGDSTAADAAEGLVIRNNVFENITSATKGGYGILLNNGAGNPGVIIEGNSFNGISGGWTHAIGLEGPTSSAKVENNTFAGLTATSPDNSAIFFEDNSEGGSVAVKYNKFFHSGLGVGIHPDDQPGGTNNFDYTVNASPNWWGSISGPVVSTQIFGSVTYEPWCGDAECSFLNPNYLPTGVTADAIQAAIDAAPAGEIIVIPAGTHSKSGGFTIGKAGVTIRLADGAIIQNSTPCFTVNAYNVTITSATPGGLPKCVPTGSSDGIVVNAGVQGLRIVGIEIDGSTSGGTADGIHFNGAITNFQIVNNFIHDLDGDGVEFTAQPTGEVMEIQGNLFQNNGGLGVNNSAGTAAINAEYNSWGHYSAPAVGTDISENVDADPWTHVDLYMESTTHPLWPDKVAKHQQISYTVYGNFQNVMGADFVLNYPETLLACLNCSPTSGNPDPEGAFDNETITVDATAGTIHYVGYNTTTGAKSGTAVALFTVTFEANLTGTGVLNLVETTDLFSMAPEGEPASSNNVYAAALLDGSVTVIDIFDVTGIFSMQGRVFRGDIPVTLTSTEEDFPYGPWTEYSLDVLGINWSVTSLPAGGYLITTNQPRYLNITAALDKQFTLGTANYTLPALMLRGGNVKNEGDSLDKVDLGDAGMIGAVYGNSGDPLAIPADANFDGKVNILDLALVGGNYLLTTATAYTSWAPLP